MVLRGDPPAGQDELRARPRAASATPPIWSPSSASATAARSAWAAPATPRGTSSAATSIRTSAHLKAKVDAGLDFVVTQLFFDNRVYFDFVDARARRRHHRPDRPGLMPIRTVAGIERMTKLCGASIPPALLAELRALPRRRRGGRGAGHRADHRAGRRAAPRRRAGHPLLHAEPVARDARDPDRAQDRAPRLTRSRAAPLRPFPRVRSIRTLAGEAGAKSEVRHEWATDAETRLRRRPDTARGADPTGDVDRGEARRRVARSRW